MATETLILRPTSIIDYSGVEPIPSETTVENWHKLINEEVADDNSTKLTISISKTETDYITVGHDFTRPGAISSAKIYIRYIGSEKNIDGIMLYLEILDNNGSTIGSEDILVNDLFDDSVFNFYSKTIEISNYDLLNSIKNGLISLKLNLYCESTPSKEHSLGITQLYIELTHDGTLTQPIESPLLFIKSDNSWTTLHGTLYEKKDGDYILSDLSILTNGQNYIINYIE